MDEGQSHDGLDLVNLSGAECHVRRHRQIQLAVRRKPRQPELDGMDEIIDAGVNSTGGLFLTQHDAYMADAAGAQARACLLYPSPSPRDRTRTRMPASS